MEKTTNKSNKATFLILAAVAFIMMVVSFFLPPTGVIHQSVIKGAAIMLGFAALTYVPDFINAGTDIQFKHKDTYVTISNPDPKAQEEDSLSLYLAPTECIFCGCFLIFPRVIVKKIVSFLFK